MASEIESLMSTDSPKSSSSSEYAPVEKRGRGRGRRGRPRGGRGGGEGPSGRGRGSLRGKRKKTGVFELTEEEAGRLRQQKMDIKERAKKMVQDLTGDAAKEVLCAAAEAMPSLVLDIADRVQSARQVGSSGPESPEPEGGPSNQPDWCICTRCRETLPEDVRVCCGYRPDMCQSVIPEIELITDVNVLTMQRIYRNDVFARHNATPLEYNKAMRHAGYRQYILFEYGRLGRGVRRPVPSCVTWYIRDKFPGPNGQYVPYVPSW